MKKFLVTILILGFAVNVFAADTKISGLTADGTPTSDDLGATVNDPGGTPANRKVTMANWLAGKIIITDNESTAENNPICFVAGGDLDGDTTNGLSLETDGDCYYTPSTGVITCTGFAGDLTGDVTGNASTATALAANPAAATAGSCITNIAANGDVEAEVDVWTESENTSAGYIANVSEDATPTLGGDLDAGGNNITNLADVTFQTGASGGTLRTGTSAADKFQLQAYDVDNTAYVNILELDAGNTITMEFNESGWADFDFRIETDLEDNFFYIDGGAEWLRVGDWDTNYIQITKAGVVTFAGSGDIDLPAGSVDYADLNSAIITAAAAVGTFEAGDTFLCNEAGVGVRECDYSDLPGGGTDDQTIDIFSFSTPNISLSLESDGEATKTLDISSLVLPNISQVSDITATASEINAPLDGALVTLTEFKELETVGATTISANQWAAVGGMPETLSGTELGYVDGVTSAIQTQMNGKEATVTEGSLADDTIVAADLKISNAEVNGYALTSNTGTGGFTWVELTGGAETNSLETTISGILDAEIFIGNGADSGTFVAVTSAGGDGGISNAGVLTVDDDEHNHTTTTISGLDISADTNLASGNGATVNGDTVDFDCSDVTDTAGDGVACSTEDITVGGGRSLTADTTGLDADAELYTDVKCIYIEDPVDGDDLQSIWTANGFAATITKIWCEGDNATGSQLDLQVDDGTPADVNGADLDCDDTPAEDETMGGDATMADGDRLDIAMTSAGSNTWLSICWTYTKDD